MKPSCFRLYNYAVENLHADKLLKEQRGKSGGNPIKWTVREEGGVEVLHRWLICLKIQALLTTMSVGQLRPPLGGRDGRGYVWETPVRAAPQSRQVTVRGRLRLTWRNNCEAGRWSHRTSVSLLIWLKEGCQGFERWIQISGQAQLRTEPLSRCCWSGRQQIARATKIKQPYFCSPRLRTGASAFPSAWPPLTRLCLFYES